MTQSPTIRYRVALILASVFLLGLSLAQAFATPIVGQQLYYQGGAIEITILPYEAYFTNSLFLFTPNGPVQIANNVEVGKVITLHDLGLSGVAIGNELVFGINVLNNGDQFVIGPATRNIDDTGHFRVDYTASPNGGIAQVGVEDLIGGGDLDYNDFVFLAGGAIGLTPPPRSISAVDEPGPAILLVAGLAGLGLLRRKQTA